MNENKAKILEYDPLLAPYRKDIELRIRNYNNAKIRLLGMNKTLDDFANGHLFYGFHQTDDGWIYREWAAGAEKLFLTGDFNNWDRQSHQMTNIGNGNFEIYLHGRDTLAHGSQVKVHICTHGNSFDRIPLYIKRIVQQPDTSFNGVIWNPSEKFHWTDWSFAGIKDAPLLIYECHVGMSSEDYHVSTFNDFTRNVLPYISNAGYNAIQLMAIMEHTYYASFGYQVSNFFAVSSRFGTPDDLKNLVNKAHEMGIAVILDIVHSHASVNELDGIGNFDGTDYQFFHKGKKGIHPAWGTKLFDYAKPEVTHFLLSNIKFWLSEYHFDGFRFDGITSMLYHNHGMEAFNNYKNYFSLNTNTDAVVYLQLATELSREINPNCILIAEDMSGMPGMCVPISEGGIGFDYRLAMGVPDFWIRTLRKKKDEEWDLGQLWYELNQRRPKEKVIGYCESHDQALVGDKTIIFWLADQEMYWSMSKFTPSHTIDRAISLHKMIRFITATCAGEGYMNFMGNEFGHPEWIDFPREGNGWSYHYARRQWHLASDENLRYRDLFEFDKAMVRLLRDNDILGHRAHLIIHDNAAKILVFLKGSHLFLFNFHPANDYTARFELGFQAELKVALHSDWTAFGGYVRIGSSGSVITGKTGKGTRMEIATKSRSAVAFKVVHG